MNHVLIIRNATLELRNCAPDNYDKARTAYQLAAKSIAELKTTDPKGLWRASATELKTAFKRFYLDREKQLEDARDQDLRLTQLRITDPDTAAIAALSDAAQRTRDIDRLVRSIKELSDMFDDLAILVDEESAMLNNIEAHVEIAVQNVKQGNKRLIDTIALQKKTRKTYCCVCIILSVLLIIAVTLGVTLPRLGSF